METKTSVRKITGIERENRALEMRKSGCTYLQIGNDLGITQQGAHKAVMRALKKLNEKIVEDAGPVRRLELERLDRMLMAIWDKVEAGNFTAIDRALAIAARRAKLMGLDEPEVHDLNMVEMTLEEWRKLRDERNNQASETLFDFEEENE